MKFSFSRSLAFMILVASLSACASKSNDRFHTREGSFWDQLMGRTSYASLFDQRTKEARIHSDFEPVMIAFITDWDTRLREAYVKEMRDQFRLSDEAEKALAKEQLAEDEAYFVFIASIATREPSWNDLNQKRSMWRTTLENKDSTIQVDPERIELIPQKDESAKYYYRKMDTFNQTYKIRFPRAALKDAQDVYFHISGPRGGITVRFPNPAPKRSIDDAPDAR